MIRSFLTAFLLWQGVTTYAATQATVNSTNNTDTADSVLTLTEAIGIVNGGFRALTPAESAQVVTIGAHQPHQIQHQRGGSAFHHNPGWYRLGCVVSLIVASDVVVDGYSQPGSSPNTNPILASNNAVIKIVIDTRTTVNNDGEPALGPLATTTTFAA